MVRSISDGLRLAVKKGQIRNTVLRQVKTLEKAKKLLSQSERIKLQEIEEGPPAAKTRKLKRQVAIIQNGLGHLMEALKGLERYKDTSVSSYGSENSAHQ